MDELKHGLTGLDPTNPYDRNSGTGWLQGILFQRALPGGWMDVAHEKLPSSRPPDGFNVLDQGKIK